jgi:hypothetical protein
MKMADWNVLGMGRNEKYVEQWCFSIVKITGEGLLVHWCFSNRREKLLDGVVSKQVKQVLDGVVSGMKNDEEMADWTECFWKNGKK